jgi:hypothetical protein
MTPITQIERSKLGDNFDDMNERYAGEIESIESLSAEAEWHREEQEQDELDRTALEFIALVPVWDNSAWNDRPSSDIPF